jgi:hypothetical protein
MATKKDLERTAAAILQEWKQSISQVSNIGRSNELVRQIEKLAEMERTAKRDNAFRVSVDGMYLRKNAGSYTSKVEAERAIDTIKRLSATRRAKDVESEA